MPIELSGRWELEVTKTIHTWENRFVIEGSTESDGVYPANDGDVVVADGLPSWELRGEYEDPSEPGVWQNAAMRRLSREQNGADLRYVIGSEDPLPIEDYEDIQWEAEFVGSMVDVPYRPYAIRTTDFFQMPDGLFETAFGTYYMAVRVRNTWGESLSADDVLDVSPASRVALSTRGIDVLDAWSDDELAALGQEQLGTGIVLGPLDPGESRTVYFKVDVSDAAPRKHAVEFVCLDAGGTPDPENPKRLVTRSIFVSRSRVDDSTGELVCETDAGELRMRIEEVAFDRETAREGRRRRPTQRKDRGDDERVRRDLRRVLEDLLAGEEIDPCEIQRLLSCYCAGGDGRGREGDDLPPGDGRFTYDPFYVVPTKFSYDITPKEPFDGQYGPLPYEDPWWKVALLVLAAVLIVAGMVADIAYQDEDIVIGTLERWQRDDVDAAVCRLDTDRELDFARVLDAQSDEDHLEPIDGLDGNVGLSGPVLSRTEIAEILLEPMNSSARKVFKSGARTGLTHGIMSGFVPGGHDEASWSIDQLRIVSDPDRDEEVSNSGDSGSVWVQTETHRPVALNHSGNRGGTEFATASLLEDVMSRLNVDLP